MRIEHDVVRTSIDAVAVVGMEVMEHMNFSSTETLLMLSRILTKLLDLIGGGALSVLSHKSIVSRLVNVFIVLRLRSKTLKFVDTWALSVFLRDRLESPIQGIENLLANTLLNAVIALPSVDLLLNTVKLRSIHLVVAKISQSLLLLFHGR
jgi:hypothetical protein